MDAFCSQVSVLVLSAQQSLSACPNGELSSPPAPKEAAHFDQPRSRESRHQIASSKHAPDTNSVWLSGTKVDPVAQRPVGAAPCTLSLVQVTMDLTDLLTLAARSILWLYRGKVEKVAGKFQRE